MNKYQWRYAQGVLFGFPAACTPVAIASGAAKPAIVLPESELDAMIEAVATPAELPS